MDAPLITSYDKPTGYRQGIENMKTYMRDLYEAIKVQEAASLGVTVEQYEALSPVLEALQRMLAPGDHDALFEQPSEAGAEAEAPQPSRFNPEAARDFMQSFDEVVLAVQTRSSSSYIGFFISPKEKTVGWYEISADEEDPEFVNIWYEGGRIFSSSGEEDSYSLEDVPDEARFLRYIDSATVPKMSGFTADHVLYKLFPELPDPEALWGQERDEFFATALEIARDSGRASVIV